MAIKAVVFDFDGVLVDSVAVKTEAFDAIFREEGHDLVARIRAYHLANGGISRVEKIRHIYRDILKRQLTEGKLKDLCVRFSQLVLDGVVRSRWVAGAQEFLETCRQRGLSRFVVSGTPEDELRLIINRRNMASYFLEVYGSPRRKPELLRHITKVNGIRECEMVFIGDAMTDYEAAQEVGVWFVARPSQIEDEAWNGRNIYRVSDLRDISEWLDNPRCWNGEGGAQQSGSWRVSF